jgi:hypothetical protein
LEGQAWGIGEAASAMPARNKSAKSSVEYLPEVKRRLSELKIELRFRGVKHVSESEVIAFLILSANLDVLEKHFRARQREIEREAKKAKS